MLLLGIYFIIIINLVHVVYFNVFAVLLHLSVCGGWKWNSFVREVRINLISHLKAEVKTKKIIVYCTSSVLDR